MGLILKEENYNGEPEDLARVIDKLMAQGSGHLVIDIDDDGGFTASAATECGPKGACEQPTEFQDEDFEDDDED